jgi:hypothetical protein
MSFASQVTLVGQQGPLLTTKRWELRDCGVVQDGGLSEKDEETDSFAVLQAR